MPSINRPPATPSPSPTPPPQPPIALTPGKRASALRDIYTKTLSATLSSITYATFAECFPSIDARALQALHADMVGKLGGFAMVEFERVCEERGVVEGLNGLEVLVEEAWRRRARCIGEDGSGEGKMRGPHTYPPDTLVEGHIHTVLSIQQGQLNAKLQTAQSQNASLRERMEEQRREIEGLVGGLEVVVRDLEGAGRLVGEVGEGLGVQSREAEGAIGDVRMGGH